MTQVALRVFFFVCAVHCLAAPWGIAGVDNPSADVGPYHESPGSPEGAKPLVSKSSKGQCSGTLRLSRNEDTMARENFDNPLLGAWEGEFGGVPPFDKIKATDFEQALTVAIVRYEETIHRIVNGSESPSISTLIYIEQAERELGRVQSVFDYFTSNLSSPEIQKLETVFVPRLVQLKTRFYQNERLFEKIRSLYSDSSKRLLSAESQRLIKVYYDKFLENGALLTAAERLRLAEIDSRLAELYTRFKQNLIRDESDDKLLLKISNGDLDGLPKDFGEMLKSQAQELGLGLDVALLFNSRSVVEQFLTYSSRRDLRQQAFEMFQQRGGHIERETFNGPIVSEIVALRQEKARLFLFSNFVEQALSVNMFKNVQQVNDLMEEVWKGLLGKAGPLLENLNEALQKDEGREAELQPWDYRYYAEKYVQSHFEFQSTEMAPYLAIEKVRSGLFKAGESLFGLKWTRVHRPVPNASIEVYAVRTKTDQFIGYWYFDWFARDGKRSGAWMSELRPQDHLDGNPTFPIVTNNVNIVKGAPGQPTYLSWDDVNTIFHEFGHGLHGISSKVIFPRLAGTNTPADYVEIPSQFFEAYALSEVARAEFTNQEGRALPLILIKRMKQADEYKNIFYLLEFMSSMWLDHEIHKSQDSISDPLTFQVDLLKKMGAPAAIPPRHPLLAFQHLFTTDFYAGNYSSYLMSRVASDDSNGAFDEASDPFDFHWADRFFSEILTTGNSRDPMASFIAFRGRAPEAEAYLKKNGLWKNR